MGITRQMVGGAGAAWGALLPLLALFVAIPTLVCTAWCPPSTGGSVVFGVDRPGHRMTLLDFSWAPYFDNSSDGQGGGDSGRGCRSERSPLPPPLRITRFAFPRTFDPAAFPKRSLFACILARADGTMLAVRLAQPIHGGAGDRTLVDVIRKDWRLEGTGGRGAGWERVRLNEGPLLDEPIYLRL
jgi:hypothetical protein